MYSQKYQQKFFFNHIWLHNAKYFLMVCIYLPTVEEHNTDIG